MHPHHQVHVLTNRVRAVAAQLQSQLAGKATKGPGDNQQAIQRAPALAAEQEAAQVLHYLDGFYGRARQVYFRDAPGDDAASIDHSHNAAHSRHALWVQKHGQCYPQQRVAFQHHVGIHRTKVPAARNVQAGVQRVALAPVFFVQHQQAGFGQADIGGAHRLGLQPRLNDALGRDQLEGARQPGQDVVLAAVVDHDHLQLRVRQAQQRTH